MVRRVAADGAGVALIVRTRRPFFRSRPGTLLLWSTVTLIAVALAIPYFPFAAFLDFVPLPGTPGRHAVRFDGGLRGGDRGAQTVVLPLAHRQRKYSRRQRIYSQGQPRGVHSAVISPGRSFAASPVETSTMETGAGITVEDLWTAGVPERQGPPEVDAVRHYFQLVGRLPYSRARKKHACASRSRQHTDRLWPLCSCIHHPRAVCFGSRARCTRGSRSPISCCWHRMVRAQRAEILAALRRVVKAARLGGREEAPSGCYRSSSAPSGMCHCVRR